jgi:rhodanese-related sulfurtransferase
MKILLTNIMGIFLALFITSGICFGISAEQMKDLIDRNEKITLIDIREKYLYGISHIPGAINIPASLCSVKTLPPIGRVIVYGDGLDEGAAMDAVNALNEKNGIQAELLEGGLSRWEAVNFPSTRKNGMEEKRLRYITYKKLKSVVNSNPHAVLVDLRSDQAVKRNITSAQASTGEEVNASADKELTDLKQEFSNARVIQSPFQQGQENMRTAGGLKAKDKAHGDYYILIDNGDGSSEKMARYLKAAGVRRVAILAGGEETLVRKGEHGLKKKVNRIKSKSSDFLQRNVPGS